MMRDATVSALIFGAAFGLLASWALSLTAVSMSYAFVGLVLFGALHARRAQTRRRHRFDQRWESGL
jgi:Flp pilus assembly protein TadB